MKVSILKMLLLIAVIAVPTLAQTGCKAVAAGTVGAAVGAAAVKHRDRRHHDDDD